MQLQEDIALGKEIVANNTVSTQPKAPRAGSITGGNVGGSKTSALLGVSVAATLEALEANVAEMHQTSGMLDSATVAAARRLSAQLLLVVEENVATFGSSADVSSAPATPPLGPVTAAYMGR